MRLIEIFQYRCTGRLKLAVSLAALLLLQLSVRGQNISDHPRDTTSSLKDTIPHVENTISIAEDSISRIGDTISIQEDTIASIPDTLPLQQADTAGHYVDSLAARRDSAIHHLLERLIKVKQYQQQNNDVISGLLQGNRTDSKSKYELIKNNLINANVIYHMLNNSINKLRSKESIHDLTRLIDSLSKPDNRELGFSFNNQIMKMVSGVLLKGKSLRKRQSKDIINTVSNILESPIFRQVTSISPSLGIANSLMTFLRSEEVNEYVDAENLKQFERQLGQYLIYYKALNEADSKFKEGLSFRDDQLRNLQVKLYYSLEFVGSPLAAALPDTSGDQSIEAAMTAFFDKFTQERVIQYFDELEKKYISGDPSRINYEDLLRNNMRLKEINNNLESLVLHGKKLENIYNSYLDLINADCANVSAALDVAGDYQFASKDAVKKEQAKIASVRERTIQAISDSIQIKSLLANLDKINYEQKVF